MAYASGPTVILTLPSKERKLYHIKSSDPVKFYDHEGKEITVFDLRKNMQIKATKLTEAPRTALVANIAVTGTAPAAGGTTQTAAKPAAAAQPAAAQSQQASTQASAETPKTLPKTGSQLPLLGLIGWVSVVAALGLGVARRR